MSAYVSSYIGSVPPAMRSFSPHVTQSIAVISHRTCSVFEVVHLLVSIQEEPFLLI